MKTISFVDCLLVDTEKDYTEVISYDLNGFDHTKLWRMRELNQVDLTTITLTLSDAPRRPDVLQNPLSWLICSERFTEILRESDSRIQTFNCKIVNANGENVSGYQVINVIDFVDALDRDNSKLDLDGEDVEMVYTWVFRQEKIPSGKVIFRDRNFPYNIFFTRSLALMFGGMSGFYFLACEVR